MKVKIDELAAILIRNSSDVAGIIRKCCEIVNFSLNERQQDLIEERMKNFHKTFLRNWRASNYTERTFNSRHRKWLSEEIDISVLITVLPSSETHALTSGKKRGPKEKNFDDLAPSTKRKRIAKMKELNGNDLNLYLETSRSIALERHNQDLKNVLDFVIENQDSSEMILKQLKRKEPNTLDDDEGERNF